jgi:hypothetical protein
MHRSKLNLRAALSPDHLAEPDDILDTKKTLMALGYYQPLDDDAPGAWVDSDLFAGIRQFQRDHGLKVDALLRPGGPTENAMNAALEEAPQNPPANDDLPPANDDDQVALIDCYHRYDVIDGGVCRGLSASAKRARCWQSAAVRLGACRTNQSLPPLVTW